jgi:hypothetical protein
MPDSLTNTATELSTQKKLLLARDKRLRERFDELYKRKRLRLDDVLEKLEAEFFISQRTIRGIMKAGEEADKQAKPGEQFRLFN